MSHSRDGRHHLVSFPDALADSIRGLSGKEANAIAKKWAKTEDLEGTKATDLAEYLTSLAAFLSTHSGPYLQQGAELSEPRPRRAH